MQSSEPGKFCLKEGCHFEQLFSVCGTCGVSQLDLPGSQRDPLLGHSNWVAILKGGPIEMLSRFTSDNNHS